MMHRLSTATVLGLSLLVVGPARLDAAEPAPVAATVDAGPDEVQLANGGVLRGTVVALDPGNEVTILVAGTDKARVVPWSEVANVERGKYAPGAAQPPAAPASAPAPLPPPAPPLPPGPPADAIGPGMVRLHIDSSEPGVTLIEEVSAAYGSVGGYGFAFQELREVCAAPCDRVIDARRGQSFFFAGEGMPASDSFTLSAYEGDLTATVDAGSLGLAVGGWMFVLTGGMSVALSPLFFVLGTMESTDYEYDPATGESRDVTEPTAPWATAVGGVTLGVGAAMLVGGIVMIAFSGTDYELTASGAGSRTARAPRYWLGEF